MQIIYYISTTVSSLYELMTVIAKDTSLEKVQANNKLNIFCNWWYTGFSYPFSFVSILDLFNSTYINRLIRFC